MAARLSRRRGRRRPTVRAGRCTVCASRSSTPRTQSRRPDPVLHRGRHRRGLATRRRARIEHALARRRRANSATSCDASSCMKNSPLGASGVQRIAGASREAGGGGARGRSRRRALRARGSSSRRFQRVGPQRQRRRAVVEPRPRLRVGEARSVPASATSHSGCERLQREYAIAADDVAVSRSRGGSGSAPAHGSSRRSTALTSPDALPCPRSDVSSHRVLDRRAYAGIRSRCRS